MIDAINLRLIEHAEKLFVKSTRGVLIASKRFFDDDARPRFVGLGTRETGFTKLLDDLQIDFRRSGQIKKPIAAELSFSIECVQALRKTAKCIRIVIIPGKVLKMF